MTIKTTLRQKLLGLVAASLVAMGAAGPLAAIADGSYPDAGPASNTPLTAQQTAAVKSISIIIGNLAAQVKNIAATRAAETQLFAQWLAELHTMQVELAQGSVTPLGVASMATTINAMASQAAEIAARRGQENNILALLPGLLQQLNSWLATLPH